MLLSSADMGRVASLGIGGFVVASLFQVANVMFEKRVNILKLQTPTEVMHVFDKHLYNQFLGLEEYARKVDTIAFIRLVDSADRILFTHKLLQDKKIEVGVQDIESANADYQRAKRSMDRILLKIETVMIPKDIITVQDYIQEINNILSNHVVSIFVIEHN